jgi:hypothetical protein
MMTTLRTFHIAWLVLLLAASRAHAAQSRSSAIPRNSPPAATPSPADADSVEARRHRVILTGLVIGGFVGAWVGHSLAAGICDTPNPPGCNTIRGTVAGALAGAFAGGAVGAITFGSRATHREFRIGIAWRQPNGR